MAAGRRGLRCHFCWRLQSPTGSGRFGKKIPNSSELGRFCRVDTSWHAMCFKELSERFGNWLARTSKTRARLFGSASHFPGLWVLRFSQALSPRLHPPELSVPGFQTGHDRGRPVRASPASAFCLTNRCWQWLSNARRRADEESFVRFAESRDSSVFRVQSSVLVFRAERAAGFELAFAFALAFDGPRLRRRLFRLGDASLFASFDFFASVSEPSVVPASTA
jgi:hypothetical protein